MCLTLVGLSLVLLNLHFAFLGLLLLNYSVKDTYSVCTSDMWAVLCIQGRKSFRVNLHKVFLIIQRKNILTDL